MKQIYRIDWLPLVMLMAMVTVTAQKMHDLIKLSLEGLMNMEGTVAFKSAERIPDVYSELNLYAFMEMVNLFLVSIRQELSWFVQIDNGLIKEIWMPFDCTEAVPEKWGGFMLFEAKFSLS